MLSGEDDFSKVVLGIAVALYLAIITASFGGLVVSRPTIGQAILDAAKDYGSIIAGIPVFVAVLIAKQQLDASRRQHIATIKLGYRDELDGLQVAREIAKTYKNHSQFDKIMGLRPRRISDSDIAAVSKTNSPEVIEAFNVLYGVVNLKNKYERKPFGHSYNEEIFALAMGKNADEMMASNDVLRAVDVRMEYLRQFMPDLQ